MLHHASKLQFDLERREKRITDVTAELEVLRKERQDLEVTITVCTKRVIILVSEILTQWIGFQGPRARGACLQTQET